MTNCFGGREPFIERIGLLLLDELRSPVHPAQEYITQALSHALACHLALRFGAEQRKPQRLPAGLHPAALQRVQDYIQSHLHLAIDLDTLAGIANVSPLAYRRAMLHKNPRALAVLNLAAEATPRTCNDDRSAPPPMAQHEWPILLIGQGECPRSERWITEFHAALTAFADDGVHGYSR